MVKFIGLMPTTTSVIACVLFFHIKVMENKEGLNGSKLILSILCKRLQSDINDSEIWQILGLQRLPDFPRLVTRRVLRYS